MKRLHYGKMANMMVAAIVAITALASCGGQSGKPKNTSTSGLIAIAVDESFQNIMNQLPKKHIIICNKNLFRHIVLSSITFQERLWRSCRGVVEY